MDQGNGNTTYPTNFAPSIHSSRMTDAASEDADEYYPEGAAAKKAKKTTQKKSIAGSSRPTSPPASFYSGRSSTRRRFGGPGLSMANSSRPEALYNRNSMTHAPSITSHAFFRPMSSQRLQAQRNPRPNTGTQASSRLSTGTMERPSMDSNNTATPTTPKRREHIAPPSSGGSEFGEIDDHDLAIPSPLRPRNDTLESTAESTRPLQANRPPNGGSEHQAPSPFRNNFRMPAKSVQAPGQVPIAARDDITARTASPHLRQKITQKPSIAGKNYEYFSGNTVFCMGGRLQNTRDRPISIVTGTLMIVPIVLFFVFE